MKAIKRKKVANLVFDQLMEEIAKGRWVPGTKIPSENELTKIFGVSRITIREALQRLGTLGIIETHQGEGTFVRQLSAGDFLNSLIPMFVLDPVELNQVMEFRRIIEVETAGLVVERATDKELERLEEIFQRMKEYRNNAQQFAAEDLSFHIVLAESSKNVLIIKINQIVKDVLVTSMTDIVHALGSSYGLYYHQKLLEALRRRDKQKAMEVMEEHINKTIEVLHQHEAIK